MIEVITNNDYEICDYRVMHCPDFRGCSRLHDHDHACRLTYDSARTNPGYRPNSTNGTDCTNCPHPVPHHKQAKLLTGE